jgi:acetylornithine/succinyldiaminopimelate/putrescine aminotransferase
MAEPRQDFSRLLGEARREIDGNFGAHGNPPFGRMLRLTGFDRRWVQGEGAILIDDTGRRYIDCIAGYAVHGIGRSHPDMVAALRDALASGTPNWVQFERNPLAALLARRLAERVPGELNHVFFSNSGTEAIECALKLARRATGRAAVLHCDMAFHGLTLGALAANGNPKLRDGFGPLGESECIPFDSLGALEQALASRRFAAFLIEPVQGKSCRVLSDGFLAEASRLCARFGTLLVVDEVQTGIGRTGRFLALEHDAGCRPDMVVLSKALAGGFVPIGATLVRKDIWSATFDSMSRALLHASTFQGGVLAMTAGLMTLAIHDRERLADRADRLGGLLRQGFERNIAAHGGADEVRGRGLMLGMPLRKSPSEKFISRIPIVGPLEELSFGQAFVMELLAEHAVLCQVTESHSNILKFTPPLVIDEDQCSDVVTAVDATLRRLANGVSASIGSMRHLVRNLTQSRAAEAD